MPRAVAGLVVWSFLWFLSGCGGGSTPAPPPPGPTVSPATAAVVLSGTQQFNLLSGTGTSVIIPATWSVNGVQGGNTTIGTIDSTGKYTAPAAFPTPDTLMVTGTAPAGSANANLTVVFPNDNHLSQTPPVKLGTTGGNNTDLVNHTTTISCCSGTLGGLIQRGGTLFILSNNHVLDKSDTGAAGDPIGQPGLVDNNCNPGTTVANLTEHAALKPTSVTTTGACAGQPAPCGPAPSNVDAAIATIVAGQVDTSGAILDLGAAAKVSIAAAPPSATLANPSSVMATNEGVAKSGRSTGLTCSTLQSVATTVSVEYSASCGSATAFTATFTNQVIVNGGAFSASGDSGSLIVTSDTARPVALLYGGNNTSTSANPIQDVMAAFTNSSGTPAMVGGSDHKVSCEPTASSSAAPPASSASASASFSALSTQERQRVAAVRQRRAAELMRNRAITSVDIGASEDHPGEGALLIHVPETARGSIPPLVDGVRTRVIVIAAQSGKPSSFTLEAQAVDQAIAVKENHADVLMSQAGGSIQGVGVGRSSDNPSEPSIVFYVLTGMPRPVIPAVLDGIRTKIVEGDRFRAFGWGKDKEPAARCSKR
jgi:hypothetical protein